MKHNSAMYLGLLLVWDLLKFLFRPDSYEGHSNNAKPGCEARAYDSPTLRGKALGPIVRGLNIPYLGGPCTLLFILLVL